MAFARMGAVKIAVISGSLKASSANRALVRAASRSTPAATELVEFGALADVPNLDPALAGDDDQAPRAVVALRRLLRSSDALLIASPEYGHSMPGTLKNALDWLVG